MRIFRMMNYVSDWIFDVFFVVGILMVFGILIEFPWGLYVLFLVFLCFFWCWGLDEINMLESWYWKSELDGSFTSQWQKVRSWREHWQVYVTDVEFTRDGTVLVYIYIEKWRDWFRTYHYVVLAFSWLPQLSFAHKAPKGPCSGWRKLLEKRIHLRGQGNCMFGWRTWSRPGKTAGGIPGNFNAETLMTGWEEPLHAMTIVG